MTPAICSAWWTISGAASDEPTLRLFILSAQLMDSRSSMPEGCAVIESNSPASASQLLRMACSWVETLARRVAMGGTVPGLRRASARTNEPARDTASPAMPDHRADHRMCEYGTMVCADESAKEPGMICSTGPDDSSLKPGLQVPRMPMVSQLVVWVSL